jgi:hypothetical protein
VEKAPSKAEEIPAPVTTASRANIVKNKADDDDSMVNLWQPWAAVFKPSCPSS